MDGTGSAAAGRSWGWGPNARRVAARLFLLMAVVPAVGVLAVAQPVPARATCSLDNVFGCVDLASLPTNPYVGALGALAVGSGFSYSTLSGLLQGIGNVIAGLTTSQKQSIKTQRDAGANVINVYPTTCTQSCVFANAGEFSTFDGYLGQYNGWSVYSDRIQAHLGVNQGTYPTATFTFPVWQPTSVSRCGNGGACALFVDVHGYAVQPSDAGVTQVQLTFDASAQACDGSFSTGPWWQYGGCAGPSGGLHCVNTAPYAFGAAQTQNGCPLNIRGLDPEYEVLGIQLTSCGSTSYACTIAITQVCQRTDGDTSAGCAGYDSAGAWLGAAVSYGSSQLQWGGYSTPPQAVADVAPANLQCLVGTKYDAGSCQTVGGLTGVTVLQAPVQGPAPTPSPSGTASPGPGVCGVGACGVPGVLDGLRTDIQGLISTVTQLPARIWDEGLARVGLQLPVRYQGRAQLDIFTPVQTVQTRGCVVFPFSIPCNVRDLLAAVNATPVAPHLAVTLSTQWGDIPITGDFAGSLDAPVAGGFSIVQIIRAGELALFTLGLALGVRRFMGPT